MNEQLPTSLSVKETISSTVDNLQEVAKMTIIGDDVPIMYIDTQTLDSTLPDEIILILTDKNLIFSSKPKLIHLVAFYGRIATFEKLIQLDANISLTDAHSRTVVHFAAANGKLNFLKYLHDINFNISLADDKSWTFVHYAAKYNHPEVINWAAQKNFNLNSISEDGTPLHIACYHRNFRVVDALCKNDIEPNIISRGKTPLILCLNRYFFEAIPLLIAAGMNINQQIQSGWTTLHHSVRIRSFLFTRVIVQYGANVNVQDPFGWTPLHLAVQGMQVEIVKLLLEKGANPRAVTRCGSSVIMLANNCFDCPAKSQILMLLNEYL